jgi:hypothetical protein
MERELHAIRNSQAGIDMKAASLQSAFLTLPRFAQLNFTVDREIMNHEYRE